MKDTAGESADLKQALKHDAETPALALEAERFEEEAREAIEEVEDGRDYAHPDSWVAHRIAELLPKKTITLTICYDVRETMASVAGNVEWLAKAISEYVTDREYPLRDDYGPNADGGYDGAYITAARVISTKINNREVDNA
jgi:hypothetical protein